MPSRQHEPAGGTTTSYSFLPGRQITTGYSYDAASNRTGFTDPEGGTVAYGYDVLNRMTSLNSSVAGNFGFGYDDLSRRTSLTRPNGVVTNYSYDNLSRLLSVLHQAGGTTTIDGATYTYDNAGNRLAKSNSLDSSSESYAYDAIYQLQQVTHNGTVSESYTYDPVGNRLSSLGVSPYNYNSSNELTSTPTATFTYDHNGNTLTKTDSSGTTQYAWDFENRLTSVTLPNGAGVVSFTYDPFGRRIEKSGPSGTVIYAYDGANGVEELDASGAATARYVEGSGIDEPLAQSGAALNFYEADGLGSITSLTDSTGTASQIYMYDAYGNLTGSAGTLANGYGYTGRDYDQETGLYYYRARYYDPTMGRFASEDPVGIVGGGDFYVYAANGPTTLSDPLGLAPSVAPPPTISPWTAAEEAAYQTFVRGLEGTSRVLSKLGTSALALGYLLDPSAANNDVWAKSADYQFEKHCSEESSDESSKDCQKASSWQLRRVLEASGAETEHEFKSWYVGKSNVSTYDICACKDGSVVIKQQGQCGKPGGEIPTEIRWK